MDSFYRGLLQLSARESTPLAGGDLAHADKAGLRHRGLRRGSAGSALRRDGARPGDGIYVSGGLGGSAWASLRDAARHGGGIFDPEPRLALGRFLRERLHATAAMDLSDGLSLDLQRLALASGLSAEIAAPPIFPGRVRSNRRCTAARTTNCFSQSHRELPCRPNSKAFR